MWIIMNQALIPISKILFFLRRCEPVLERECPQPCSLILIHLTVLATWLLRNISSKQDISMISSIRQGFRAFGALLAQEVNLVMWLSLVKGPTKPQFILWHSSVGKNQIQSTQCQCWWNGQWSDPKLERLLPFSIWFLFILSSKWDWWHFSPDWVSEKKDVAVVL